MQLRPGLGGRTEGFCNLLRRLHLSRGSGEEFVLLLLKGLPELSLVELRRTLRRARLRKEAVAGVSGMRCNVVLELLRSLFHLRFSAFEVLAEFLLCRTPTFFTGTRSVVLSALRQSVKFELMVSLSFLHPLGEKHLGLGLYLFD